MTINATQSDLSKLPPRAASQEHPLDLIARLLREQSTLTAVEEFSAWHQTHAEPGAGDVLSQSASLEDASGGAAVCIRSGP